MKPKHHYLVRTMLALCAFAGPSVASAAEWSKFIPAGTYAISCGEPGAERWLANPLAIGGSDWDPVLLQAEYGDTECAWRLNDEGEGYVSVRNTRGGINSGDYIMKDSKIRLASTVNFVQYRNNQTFMFFGGEAECVVLSNAEANRHWAVSANGKTLSYAVSPAASAVRFRLIPLYRYDELLVAIAAAESALADNSRDYDAILRAELKTAADAARVLVGKPGYGSVQADDMLNELTGLTEQFVASGRIPGTSDLSSLTKEERNLMGALSLTGNVSEADFLIIRSDMVNLRELHLEQTSLDALPSHAFAGMSRLETVVLPQTLRSVGPAAFLSCSSLEEIILPESVATIGAMAFARSGLRRVSLGRNVAALGAYAFDGCASLEAIEVAEGNLSLQSAGGMLMSADGTEIIKCPPLYKGSFDLQGGVKIIAPYAFQGCVAMTGVPVFPETLESIGDFAFAGCSGLNGQVVLPEGLRSVGAYAFFGNTGISGSIDLPRRLGNIGRGAFSYLPAVQVVSLPAAATTLPGSLFECCDGVSEIRSDATLPPAVGGFALRGIDRLYTFVNVPAEAVDRWRGADVWNEFNNWSAPFEGYARFALDGKYYIRCEGEACGRMDGAYLYFDTDAAGAAAYFDDFTDETSLWDLEFFEVTSASLPYAGGPGSDIRFLSGKDYLHINMEGLCYVDPAATYDRRDNRTFVFWIADNDDASDKNDGPLVAIQGNGTIFGVDPVYGKLLAPPFSGKYPRPEDFVFRLVSPEESEIVDVEAVCDEVLLYDLRGQRVTPSPSLRGIYIRRYGSETSKIIL